MRIEKELENFPNVTYEFKEIANAMQITFFKDIKDNGGVNGGVNELYNFIKQNPNLKANKISESLNIPLRTVERYLKQLKDENKIEFKGSPKTGGYLIKEEAR